ncbi:MAG TPA: response regulator [Pyrinomonadaceae bacterium]|nr:response regulator [Pyrinomonadaceae bacterium]
MLKGRILCTEDDEDTREMLVLFLREYGYEVVCSVDGNYTLDLVNRETFDLFLFDNWLPELSGVDLTLRIRQFNNSTPILFYSGAATEEEQRSALEARAQGYLVKRSESKNW